MIQCPWCGKVMSSFTLQKPPPVSGISCCSYCKNYFGCRTDSPLRYVLMIVCLALLPFLGLYAVPLCLAYLAGITIYDIISPNRKVKPQGQWVNQHPVPPPDIHRAVIVLSHTGKPLRWGNIYYTIPDFCSYPNFSQVSPIQVERGQKKDGTFTFSFLYEHEGNTALLRGGTVTLWNYRNEPEAEMQIDSIALDGEGSI